MPRKRTSTAGTDGKSRLEVPEGRSSLQIREPESYLPTHLAKVSDYLFKISTLQIFLGMLMIASYFGWQLSLKANKFKEYTELPVLTQRFHYSPSAIGQFIDALGDEGREEYQTFNLLNTFAFPLCIALVFTVAIGRLSDAAGFGHAWNLFPFVIVAVATLENVGVSVMLRQYPQESTLLATACGLAAALKWRLFMYSTLSVFGGLGWVMIKGTQNTPTRQ